MITCSEPDDPADYCRRQPEPRCATAELTTHRYPCPCCGYRVHEAPGGYEICRICFWEDDPVQLRWPQ